MPLAVAAAIHEGWAPAARAQSSIVRDGSLGPSRQEALGATGTMTRAGTPYARIAIPESHGLRAGTNVFHSFSDFRLGRGDAAVFTVAAPTTNVVSRVTGRTPSVIEGLLALEAGPARGSPNLFLLNPAGVVFAAGAVVDVPGAFHASTADHLRLQDGVVHADPSRPSTFTTADVAAFGFLPGNRGRVEVQAGARLATSQQPLTLAGSAVAILGGTVETQGGGTIRLAATGPAAADVPLTGGLPRLEGALAVTAGGSVATTTGPTTAAGDIAASAGTIRLDAEASGKPTGLLSLARGGTTGAAGDIRVVADTLVVTDGARIATETRADAGSGRVIVRARDVVLDGGPAALGSTGLASRSLDGAGNAGGVDVTAEESVRVARGASISAVTLSAGHAGDVRVNAGRVTIESAGQVTSNTHGAGNAGLVRILADSVLLDGGAERDGATGLFAQSAVEGGGRGGEVFLRGSANVEIVREAQVSVASRSAAEGGSVRVEAGSLSIRQGGQVTGRTAAAGHAGVVVVQADTIHLQGNPQDRTATTGISNDTAGAGDAGDVRVTARETLTVLDGAQISSNTSSAGNGGLVRIAAHDIAMDDRRASPSFPTGVLATASGASSGNAGKITVDVEGGLTMAGGAQLSTATRAPGAAGNITVNAVDVLLDGSRDGGRQVTSIGSVSLARGGPAGSVRVVATGGITLLRGAEIGSDTASGSRAGNVVLAAQDVTIDGLREDGTGVATAVSSDSRSEAAGAAGKVSVTATRSLVLRGGGVISSRAYAAGDAGVINVAAGAMLVDGAGGGRFTGVATTSEKDATGRSGAMGIEVQGTLELMRDGQLTVASNSVADSGLLNVDAGRLVVRQGGEITGRTAGAGRGGAVVVRAGSILLQGDPEARRPGTGISNDTGGPGAAGEVKVIALGTLALQDGAQISSNTAAAGHGGTVRIAAGDLVMDDRRPTPAFPTGVLATTGGAGNAGRILVSVDGAMALAGGAQMSTETRGSGAAGDIAIAAGSLLLEGRPTSIGSVSFPGGGQAGSVRVTAAGALTLRRGAEIGSDTASDARAGNVVLQAQDILLDGLRDGAETGLATPVSSDSRPGAGGAAGRVSVTASRSLVLRGGGVVSSRTFSRGDAGMVEVVAGEMQADGAGARRFTGVSSTSEPGATGRSGELNVEVAGKLELLRDGKLSVASQSPADGGSLRVNAGALVVRQGAEITGRSAGAGRAGAVVVQAGTVLLEGDPLARSASTGISNDADGAGDASDLSVTAREALTLLDGAQISSGTSASGNGGTIRIAAPSMTMGDRRVGAGFPTGVFATAAAGSTGRAGRIVVDVAGPLSIAEGAQLSTSTRGSGAAGDVTVSAGDLLLDGSRDASQVTGIGSVSRRGAGAAGNVRVNATGSLTVRGGAEISSDTASASPAGNVVLGAQDILVDGSREGGGGPVATSVSSDARQDATGDAGRVVVNASRSLVLRGGGVISSRTLSLGDAGSILVNAAAMRVEGAGVDAFTGVASTSEPGATGRAGSVRVNVDGLLALDGGGQVSSGTSTAGRGGSIQAVAGQVDVDGRAGSRVTGLLVQAEPGSTGAAGSVEVTARDDLVLRRGGVVASSTFGAGAAGSVTLKAARVRIDGEGAGVATGALSEAGAGSTGRAGSVTVMASELLQVAQEGRISSSTSARGAGGSVAVEAGLLRMQGGLIAAQAGRDSSGRTGNLSITAVHGVELQGQARVSIENDATVADARAIRPTMVRLAAPQILLKDSSITAAATGNVAASAVDIAFNGALRMEQSSISTASNLGDGGPVRVEGGAALNLARSQISTSVAGEQGNGGNIQVKADSLAMRTAFIQANTAARDASGGNVRIDTRVLTPSGAALFVGGSTAYEFADGVFGFNVIQAAAPSGLSGAIEISSPALDLAGTLAEMSVRHAVAVGLAGSPCGARVGSTIVRSGRGALPPSPRNALEPAARPVAAVPRATGRGELVVAVQPGCDAGQPR